MEYSIVFDDSLYTSSGIINEFHSSNWVYLKQQKTYWTINCNSAFHIWVFCLKTNPADVHRLYSNLVDLSLTNYMLVPFHVFRSHQSWFNCLNSHSVHLSLLSTFDTYLTGAPIQIIHSFNLCLNLENSLRASPHSQWCRQHIEIQIK